MLALRGNCDEKLFRDSFDSTRSKCQFHNKPLLSFLHTELEFFLALAMRHHSRGSATSRRIARLAALFSLGRVLHRARGKAVSTDRRKTRGIDCEFISRYYPSLLFASSPGRILNSFDFSAARLPRQVWKQIATCPHSSSAYLSLSIEFA